MNYCPKSPPFAHFSLVTPALGAYSCRIKVVTGTDLATDEGIFDKRGSFPSFDGSKLLRVGRSCCFKMMRNIFSIIAVILAYAHLASASLAITPIDEDQCHTASCPPNKTCLNQPDGFLCVCPAGKVGPECQYDDPCLNAAASICGFGYCTATMTGSAECVCMPGMHGENCMEDIDECHHNPCMPDEMCYNTIGSFICIPRRNFVETKQHAEDAIDSKEAAKKVFFVSAAIIAFVFLVDIVQRFRRPNQNLVLPLRFSNRVNPQTTPIPIIFGPNYGGQHPGRVAGPTRIQN